jgi:hypothetical protein
LNEALLEAQKLIVRGETDVLVTGAIATTPYLAEALSVHLPNTLTKGNSAPQQGQLVPPTTRQEGFDERSLLARLPVRALLDFSGLTPLPSAKIEAMVRFFQSIGFFSVSEILHFPRHSFRERWGDLGSQLWERLHLRHLQTLSPLIPMETLQSYFYSDFPIGNLATLRPLLEQHFDVLFMRLESRNEWAKNLKLILHCEFSETQHLIEIEPVQSCRDQNLFLSLLEKKIEKIDFQNPIREGEIHLASEGAQIEQLDFFTGRRSYDKGRWQRLLSIAKSEDIQMGFLQQKPSLIPEESYSLVELEPQTLCSGDEVIRQDESLRIKEFFGKLSEQMPQPSLLLLKPEELQAESVRNMRLSPLPLLRLENSWWRGPIARDYFVARTPHQSLLWIYWDRRHEKYFLQGYFD